MPALTGTQVHRLALQFPGPNTAIPAQQHPGGHNHVASAIAGRLHIKAEPQTRIVALRHRRHNTGQHQITALQCRMERTRCVPARTQARTGQGHGGGTTQKHPEARCICY